MINIILACQYGASTDLLAAKMQEVAKEKNLDVLVNAYSFTDLEQYIESADIVLLGPQIRFKQNELSKKFADKDVEFKVIDTADYGMLNGESVLMKALEDISKKEEVKSQ